MTPQLTALSSGSSAHREIRARARSSSWVFLFLHGLMLGSLSLYWLLNGRLFDHELYETVGGVSWTVMAALNADVVKLVAMVVRLAGAMGIVAAVFVLVVSATAYRRQERWAWYVMWALPLGSTFDVAILAASGSLPTTSFVWDVYMLALSLLGLILPYRAFFPEPVNQ